MSRSQRDKGKRGERWWVHELQRELPELAHRLRRGWQSRSGGKDECDIEGLPGIHAEAKTGKCMSVRPALLQAIEDADSGSATGRIPIVFMRDCAPRKLPNQCEPFVVMRAADFWPMLRVWLIALGHIKPGAHRRSNGITATARASRGKRIIRSSGGLRVHVQLAQKVQPH